MDSAGTLATFEQFEAIEIRVGTVIAAEPFPEARKPAYKLTLDFGDLGIKRSSAQITKLYAAEELVGRQVMAVVNFAPKRIAGFVSEVLTLGVNDGQGRVVLLGVDFEVPTGSRVY